MEVLCLIARVENRAVLIRLSADNISYLLGL
jgi:hypothetical protein